MGKRHVRGGSGAGAAASRDARAPLRPAARLSWWSVLALAGVTPLILGSVRFEGMSAAVGMWDAFSLPKLVFLGVVLAVGLCAWAASRLAEGEFALRWTPALAAIVALAVWAGISTVTSISRPLSLFGDHGRNEGLAAFVLYAGVAFLVTQEVRSISRVRAFARAFAWSGGVVGAYALVQYLGADPLVWKAAGFGSRVFATFGNPDMLGCYLVVPFAFAAGLSMQAQPDRLVVADRIALILTATGVLLTLTRAAWVGVAAVTIVFVLTAVILRMRPERPVVRFATIAGAVVLVVGVVNAPAITARLTDTFRSGFDGGRLDIWRSALELAAREPITGHGPDTFARAILSVSTPDVFMLSPSRFSAYPENAHDYPLQLLVTLGVPGLLLALACFALALRAGFRTVRASERADDRILMLAAPAAAIGSFVALLFGSSVFMATLWFWIAASFAAAPGARTLRVPTVIGRLLSAGVIAASVAIALVAGTWARAELMVGAGAFAPSDRSDELVRGAIELNPLPQRYRLVRADVAEERLIAVSSSSSASSALEPYIVATVQACVSAATSDATDLESRIFAARTLSQAHTFLPDREYARDAVRFAEEASELAPRDWRTLETLAKAYAAAGREDAAVAAMRHALEIAPVQVRSDMEEWLSQRP